VLQEMLQVRRAFYSIMDSVLQWNTLEVLYEAPRVERLWTQLGPNRLSLHRIHPCARLAVFGRNAEILAVLRAKLLTWSRPRPFAS